LNNTLPEILEKKVGMINPTEKNSRIEAIVRALRLISRMGKARSEMPESHGIYYQMLIDYYTRLLKAQEESSFVAAHSIFFPVEIFYAMDIVPMHNEVTGWMAALFSGSCADLLATSAELGLASEICSAHRVLHSAFATRALPRPDVVVWTNLVCDNSAKSGGMIMSINDCPGFFLDHPFKQTDDEYRYLKEELEDLVSFLEEQSGRVMDWDKLSENIAHTDRQIELFREIDELRQIVPSPFPPQDFLKLFTVDCLFGGQPKATEYLETFRQELIERVHAGKGVVSPEHSRVMNLSMPPLLFVGSIERISQEYGVVSVSDPFLCTWGEGRLDPNEQLESVAKKLMMTPPMVMYGPLDERALNRVINCARQHKVDGAINYAHIGCGQSAATIKYFKDALDKIGIPLLIIDCDIIDPTVAPEEDIRQKLTQFFELLEDR
jgi:benzoyl-CoA reductase/2-hydroxyglutaryl-CoA dehydratase subunit BcrC/BadD/HgdB